MDPINPRYLNILEVTVNMGYRRLKKNSKGRRKQFLPIFPRILVLQLNITRTEKKENSKQQSLIWLE